MDELPRWKYGAWVVPGSVGSHTPISSRQLKGQPLISQPPMPSGEGTVWQPLGKQ